MPKLQRDGVVYELNNPLQVAAFKAAGYVEVEAEPEKPKRSRKAKADKAAEE